MFTFAIVTEGFFYCHKFKVCYIVSNIGARVMNRLKEPSSYAGLALIFNGISDCMTGNYQSGIPSNAECVGGRRLQANIQILY